MQGGFATTESGVTRGPTALYSGPGDDTIYSAGDYVDCGSGVDTVKKGIDTNLDRFVGCEKFVS